LPADGARGARRGAAGIGGDAGAGIIVIRRMARRRAAALPRTAPAATRRAAIR